MRTSIIQPGIELRDLHSQIINQDLRLYVKLPWYYDRNDKSYPVLFCTDANRGFPLYSTISLMAETPGTGSPEIVIVGMGYQVSDDRIEGLAQWAAWRTRDFLPERREKAEAYWNELLSSLLGGEEILVQSGGAPLFLKSLLEEIIPFIQQNYRVSIHDRGLAGYSYGGLFTLYALFHAPQTFQRYFAGSPTMYDRLFEYEQDYASTHQDLEAKLTITAGSRESDVIEPVNRMVESLQSRGYPRLEVTFHVFEGEGHRSAMGAAISRALYTLYYRKEA
jgi:predicted alpha/beta superfamily hydrolase